MYTSCRSLSGNIRKLDADLYQVAYHTLQIVEQFWSLQQQSGRLRAGCSEEGQGTSCESAALHARLLPGGCRLGQNLTGKPCHILSKHCPHAGVVLSSSRYPGLAHISEGSPEILAKALAESTSLGCMWVEAAFRNPRRLALGFNDGPDVALKFPGRSSSHWLHLVEYAPDALRNPMQGFCWHICKNLMQSGNLMDCSPQMRGHDLQEAQRQLLWQGILRLANMGLEEGGCQLMCCLILRQVGSKALQSILGSPACLSGPCRRSQQPASPTTGQHRPKHHPTCL